MSAAWDGYEALRRGGRRRREWRGRFALIVGALILAAGWFGLARGWPQNLFGSNAPRAFVSGETGSPADFAVVVYNANDPLSRDLADSTRRNAGSTAPGWSA